MQENQHVCDKWIHDSKIFHHALFLQTLEPLVFVRNIYEVHLKTHSFEIITFAT